jgi:hypothetical protein
MNFRRKSGDLFRFDCIRKILESGATLHCKQNQIKIKKGNNKIFLLKIKHQQYFFKISQNFLNKIQLKA